MKELLPFLPRPSHYLGQEVNSVHKNRRSASVHMGLAFPDVYEVGMSYLGQKILYHRINDQDEYYAERVFSPSLEAAGIMREQNTPLCTLESDTPLGELDILAFSLTHELCYTNILYMLDLAGLPFKAHERSGAHPLVIAGGGATFNAEPVADYFDLMVLGDGEEVILDLLQKVKIARQQGMSRQDLLQTLKKLPGVYVPGFFKGPGLPLTPLREDYRQVTKSLVTDLNQVPFPTRQIVPYGKVIHDRLSIEIARGCTRGCRFCQAGSIYRPVRERSISRILEDVQQGLLATGLEELSFLSLSSGDFSALEELFTRSFARCQQQQVAMALPSLRVGSVNERLMQLMSRIRRTQATLAPEAGTSRLRQVINKGITEEQLLKHTGHLFDLGWKGVKLYFMVGLPTEADDDLKGIRDLCQKVLETGRSRKIKPQVTASVAPFVPKPHTPFQWERQAGLSEIREKIFRLKDLFKTSRTLNLKWHDPEMSLLEGIFSRGGRELSQVVAGAYARGETFTSWSDCFRLEPWLDIMDKSGLSPDTYLRARDTDEPLPWDHLQSGMERRYLLTEARRGRQARTSKDCRYHACRMCGVCDKKSRPSSLRKVSQTPSISNVLNRDFRDQEHDTEDIDSNLLEQKDLSPKTAHLRIWYKKTGLCIYLSQLELQSLLERAMRRAGWPLSFSTGFRPAPVIAFGRALPVGVSSLEEWYNIYLRKHLDSSHLLNSLNNELPRGMHAFALEHLSQGRRQPQSIQEEFQVELDLSGEDLQKAMTTWENYRSAPEFLVQKQTKKGLSTKDLCSYHKHSHWEKSSLKVVFTWEKDYLSPLFILQSIFSDLGREKMHITKTRQIMD
ncbi:Protein of unknown function DUF2344 [Desulfonatronospira thiodismutans ASO3-1]|uniref:Radical SAM core domain-containing protein n=1 Tax=Desulfonatronospira thiodismutans ASO3-1 TaxID=555779 RepID=D6SSX5_9BACT|nr:TIGR03960 family B12-binding radical SAM protein [Desulfonatronospira thiodismutans]EFI33791.1 Protein of unknown function DUF2344 [Desulfonatronospira thiodismutans ASO3-1]